jgi:hypothetical protein
MKCEICEKPATGVHYGVPACEGCKVRLRTIIADEQHVVLGPLVVGVLSESRGSFHPVRLQFRMEMWYDPDAHMQSLSITEVLQTWYENPRCTTAIHATRFSKPNGNKANWNWMCRDYKSTGMDRQWKRMAKPNGAQGLPEKAKRMRWTAKTLIILENLW